MIDILVLAELMIGGVKIGKADAMERAGVGADRVRILQRRRYQVVEIDRLDTEDLAHMRTAVAQDLHHLGLVPNRIEMSLDRLGLGQDLAERQRGRKNLYKNRVHRVSRTGGRRRRRSQVGAAIIQRTASIAIRSL